MNISGKRSRNIYIVNKRCKQWWKKIYSILLFVLVVVYDTDIIAFSKGTNEKFMKTTGTNNTGLEETVASDLREPLLDEPWKAEAQQHKDF